MDGSAELAKLAELLRLGARAGRQVALLRPQGDAIIIERLAEQAEAMAAELEALVASAPAKPSESDPRH